MEVGVGDPESYKSTVGSHSLLFDVGEGGDGKSDRADPSPEDEDVDVTTIEAGIWSDSENEVDAFHYDTTVQQILFTSDKHPGG